MKHNVTDDGTIIEELKLICPNYSMNKIRTLLTNNCVTLDGKVIHKAKYKIFKGQKIEIINNQMKHIKTNFKIIFEDDYLIVVNKPNKLLSISTDKLEQDTMHSRVLNYVRRKNNRNWIWIVHRLDKETSGLMIFAKSKKVKIALQKSFATNSVKRIYYAIVDGIPQKLSGRIESYLIEDKNLFVKEYKAATKNSKKAITSWEVIKNNEEYSLLKISIETGKRHQIRVHMLGINCPIVGDLKYGNKKNILSRMALHASEIEFIHPITNEVLKYKSRHNFKKIYY